MDLVLPQAGAAPMPGASGSEPGALPSDKRRWWALAVILLAQLMVILDVVIVNVALPSAQQTLHIAPANIQWVVTAYLLPFGGLLLLGGRVSDYTGRRRAFLIATVGFGVASAGAGLASSQELFFAWRAIQGAFAAVMAPAALSMITLGFPAGPERNRAFSLYTIVGATGGAGGLILGGLLTEYLSWRWCLLINCPISLLVLAGSGLLCESRTASSRQYDVPGTVLATLGLVGLIFGISQAATHGWLTDATLGPMIGGGILLAGFVVWEGRTTNPLLPLGLLRGRVRAAGMLAVASSIGPTAGLLLLTIAFLQGPERATPLTSGLSFLPGPICGVLAAAIALPLLGRVSTRWLLAAAFAMQLASLLLATRIHVGQNYLTVLAPVVVLFGAGPTLMYLVGNTLALADTPTDDAGVLGAVINTFQQVSTALGASILLTISVRAQDGYLADNGPQSLDLAIAHGNHVAFAVGGILTFGLGVLCFLVTPGRHRAERAGSGA